MMAFNLIYQFFVHTQTIDSLPRPIEFIFNTPSHHRVHHASNLEYLDKNYAGILIIWDRMFGSFALERKENPPVYGITKNIESYNPFVIATHEFSDIAKDVRKAPRWKDKLNYLFRPPGWSHDGSTQTANQMRRSINKDA